MMRVNPEGASINRCQEIGGARDWNAGWTEPRWANSASVVRYRSSTACGSSNTGGVANSKLLASAMTTQIAQASAGCWSVSGLEGACFCAASLALSGAATVPMYARSACDRPVWIAGAACAAIPWKCPNDSANWIASANSASRESVLMCYRNHFMPSYAHPKDSPGISAVPMLYYNIGRYSRCQP